MMFSQSHYMDINTSVALRCAICMFNSNVVYDIMFSTQSKMKPYR